MNTKNYVKIVKRPYPPFIATLFNKGLSNPHCYKNYLTKRFNTTHTVITDSWWFYFKADMEKASKLTFSDWSNPKFLLKVKSNFAEQESKLLNSKTLNEYMHNFMAYMPSIYLTFLLEEPLTLQLSKYLDNNLISSISVPYDDILQQKEEIELIKTRDIRKHVKKYEWILSRYGRRNPYTIKQAREKRKQLIKENYLIKYHENKRNILMNLRKAKQILKKKSHLIELLQFIVYYRTRRTNIINMSIYNAYDIFLKEAKARDLTYEDFLYLHADELFRLPDKKIIQERKRGYTLVHDESGIKIFIGEKHRSLRDKFLNIAVTDIVKGNVAYTGKVKGIVVKNNLREMKEGKILVTEMTTPNMMSLIKKASAIVTDEGGITSHAAIISRELKIPCIIGTGNATQVLKDGDMVEVDANKGIVRKIL